MILISACLIGQPVRYDGGHKTIPRLQLLIEEGKAVPVCPEVLGGLSTPRDPAEIQGGTAADVWAGRAFVRTEDGRDVTAAFLRGAEETLRLAEQLNASVVILKESSPSCGANRVYDGTFGGGKVAGHGVTTELLRRHGIRALSDEDVDDAFFQSVRSS